MAHVAVTEMKPPQAAGWDIYGRTYARKFSVYATSTPNAEDLVYLHKEVTRGVAYVDEQGNIPEPFCICRRIETQAMQPAPVGGYGHYHVTAYYGIPAFIPPPAQPGTVKRWVETQNVSEAADIDYIGQAIQNAAKEPFYPQRIRQVLYETLVIQWHSEWTDWMEAYAAYRIYNNKLNDFPWYGAPRGSFRCNGILVEETGLQPSPGAPTQYFRMTGRFEYREPKKFYNDPADPEQFQTFEGWDDTVLHQGRRELKVVNGKETYPRVRMLIDPEDPSKGTTPVIEPVMLNYSGEVDTSGKRYYMGWKHYAYVDLGMLGV